MFENINSYLKAIEGGICAVSDVKAAGVREGKYGLALISFPKSNWTGVFASNKIAAAPLVHTKNILNKGKLSAIVANSGNANCFTGKIGEEDCKVMIDSVSSILNLPSLEIAIASTGVIGRKMPMDIIGPLIEKASNNLENSIDSSYDSADAIMTTDLVPKEFAVEVEIAEGKKVKIGAICKGTGMIAPNMATMLCFIFTDAKIEDNDILYKSLKNSVDKSFNSLVVDGDESTNDEVLLIATGSSNVNVVEDNKINTRFQEGLNYLTVYLAKMMASDGEGATKFIEVEVNGAKSEEDGKLVSKSIVSSSLVKTAIFGGDPNWGRIVSAIGSSKAEFDPDNVSISISNYDEQVFLVKNSEILGFEGTENLSKAEELMKSSDIKIIVDLHQGNYSSTAFGCDLTYDYVKINAEYTT
ncbi:MAG: bifunctional ornithine acetyltransferase/N-acetylglutamate synthase [Methanobrevibacter sp.]|jgi:glutamate N-acetyltransferase/amino-acid N-acetyltransferase|nr:bifunctional ornithine acetyltransferase/N-acetylglutamate synthase [Methanobrevibacter sp.]